MGTTQQEYDPRMDKNVISTHTFLYPFTYDKSTNLSKAIEEDFGKHWRKNRAGCMPFMSAKDRYMTGQYFNEEAGKLFHLWPEEKDRQDEEGRKDRQDEDEKDVCEIYSYDADIVPNLTYHIQHLHYLSDAEKKDGKHKDNPEVSTYDLKVHRITLFLFDRHNKAGILSIETYFIPTDEQKEQGPEGLLQDIKRINDYGRRVALPYILRDPDEKGDLLCADEIGLMYQGSSDWVTDYRRKMQEWSEDRSRHYFEPPAFILGLLYGRVPDSCEAFLSDLEKQESRKNDEKAYPKIDLVIDDRMYLTCLINHDRVSKMAKNIGSILGYGKKDRSPSDEQNDDGQDDIDALQKELYAIEYADPTTPTCVNPVMREELLRKSTYVRWSDWGTLYSVTNSAFICMTSNTNDKRESVYRPFLTEYYLMTVLVLAQKISINVFAERASDNAKGAEERGLLPNSKVNDIITMHETFVSWYNQVYLLEATEQEQGIDLYNLLRTQFGVYTHMNSLRQQMADLYAVANVNQGSRLSGIAASFAILAIVVDIALNICNFLHVGYGNIWSIEATSGYTILILLTAAAFGGYALHTYNISVTTLFFYRWRENFFQKKINWFLLLCMVLFLAALLRMLRFA